MPFVLASTSASRRAMLEAVGLAFEAIAPGVDEDALRDALGERLRPRELADALAEAKACAASAAHPGRACLGGDSVVERDDGQRFDKPRTRKALAAQLTELGGRPHRLWSAAVVAVDGRPVWRHVESATLYLRPLSADFVGRYAQKVPEAVLQSVGGYHLEGMGPLLFERLDGDPFVIRGLPLLPFLAWLRAAGMLDG